MTAHRTPRSVGCLIPTIAVGLVLIPIASFAFWMLVLKTLAETIGRNFSP